MCQIYFPVPGRQIYVPKMFAEANIQVLLIYTVTFAMPHRIKIIFKIFRIALIEVNSNLYLTERVHSLIQMTQNTLA